jgi:hypothetical protein
LTTLLNGVVAIKFNQKKIGDERKFVPFFHCYVKKKHYLCSAIGWQTIEGLVPATATGE